MSDRKPNFNIRDKVVYQNMSGVVKSVVNEGGGKFKYVVEFRNGQQTIPEGRLRRG